MSVEEVKVKRTYRKKTPAPEPIGEEVVSAVIEVPKVVAVEEKKVRKPRFEKGSDEAKEWSKKMREAKAAKKALKAAA